MNNAEKTIPAGEFKAKCLAILEEVSATGETFIITKRGKPVAKLSPVKKPRSLVGSVKIEGDIISPLDVEWEAMK